MTKLVLRPSLKATSFHIHVREGSRGGLQRGGQGAVVWKPRREISVVGLRSEISALKISALKISELKTSALKISALKISALKISEN
jgi:hypothetical protein